jgi:sugar lactone lactonase YvrE
MHTHACTPTNILSPRGWLLDVSQGLPRGRLLSYDPATKETRVLAKGFYYANGVALAEDGSYVMVVETNRIRVHRHWLRGPKVRVRV